MLELCLLTLPWVFDPTNAGAAPKSVSRSISTCAQVTAHRVIPNPVTAELDPAMTTDEELSRRLRQWEVATRDAAEWSRSQREEFRRLTRKNFNEHTATAAEQLIGSVAADWLKEKYSFQVLERSSQQIRLEAVPRDETEQLFYGSLRISLSTISGNLEKLVVVQRNQQQKVAWLAEPESITDVIQLVRFDQEIPPSPPALLQTADRRKNYSVRGPD